MLSPREGFDGFAAFLDQAGPLAERWKRGLAAHTDEITQGLDDLAWMLSDLREAISREGWARFDRINAQLTGLIDTWRNDAVQDIDIALGLGRVVASGQQMLVQA